MLRTLSLATLVAIGLVACSGSKKAQAVADNTLSSKEKADGWELLFDGSSFKGWHTYGKTEVGSAWQVQDGAIFLDDAKKDGWQVRGGGDIVSDGVFENYHLALDWKISPKGNSGIIINVVDDRPKYEFVWLTGPEIQVLDNDGHPDGKIYKHRAANLYDLIASTVEPVKPVGEWNHCEIIQKGNQLEIKLNGVTTVSTTMWDDNWKALIAASKFKNQSDFGTAHGGHIALQDHGNAVWFKNIKIRKL